MKIVGTTLIILALLLFGKIVRAEGQLVTLSSGDHVEFSRIVVNFRSPQAWIIRQEGADLVMRVEGQSFDYNLSRLFEKIPRQRILAAQVRGAGDSVVFTLAPNHRAIAFETKGGALVLDVQPGAPEGEAQTSPLVSKAEKTNPIALNLPRVDLPEPVFTTREIDLPNPRVQAAQSALVAELGEAFAQGLLTPDESLPSPDLELGPLPQIDPALSDHVNLDAKTAYEIGGTPVAPRINEVKTHCLPDDAFQIVPVESGELFRESLADMHRGLSDEIDRIDSAALEKLVRFQLGNGFGAEARAILREYSGIVHREDILAEIGAILDWDDPKGEVLRGQSDCPGLAVIWAILAGDKTTPLSGAARVDFEANFAQMPAQLRKMIGPRLVDRLLDRSEPELATAIRNRMDRAPGLASDYAPIVEMKLRKSTQNAAEPDSDLNSAIAAETMILSLEALEKTEMTASDVLLADADNLAFELRFSPVGQHLRALQIKALARRGEIDLALEVLSHESVVDALPSDLSDQLTAFVFETNGPPDTPDADQVAAYFRYGSLLKTDPLFDKARLNIAGHLLEAGLLNDAWEALAPALRETDEPEAKLVAEIELRRGNPVAALNWIAGFSGADFDQIRFEALVATGDLTAALEIPPSVIDPARREQVQWRADAVNAPIETMPTAALSLNALQETLDLSKSTRKENQNLLALHPSP